MCCLLIALCLLLSLSVKAQPSASFGVAYYNVDKLYDTIPSRFYDDRDFTPQGAKAWDGSRYRHKVKQIATVVDSMALPVVALYGVENEQVVRDIAAACHEDYAYIHRTSNAYDGLDFALLYFADMFFPERVIEYRGALCVVAEVCGEPLTIVATARCTSLGVLLEEQKLLGDNNIIILGDVGKLNFKKLGLRDATEPVGCALRGNRISRGVWQLRDRVLTNIDSAAHSDVYIKRWLLQPSGMPRPTFEGAKYCAGGSSYLPIFIYFDKIFAF